MAKGDRERRGRTGGSSEIQDFFAGQTWLAVKLVRDALICGVAARGNQVVLDPRDATVACNALSKMAGGMLAKHGKTGKTVSLTGASETAAARKS